MIQLRQFEKFKIKQFSFLTISGIIFSFIILASILVILKSFGIFVGWGFQFSEYLFFNYFIINYSFIFIKSFGFFEIILPNFLVNYFGKLERKENKSGYFFSGMFATLMATPCSALF